MITHWLRMPKWGWKVEMICVMAYGHSCAIPLAVMNTDKKSEIPAHFQGTKFKWQRYKMNALQTKWRRLISFFWVILIIRWIKMFKTYVNIILSSTWFIRSFSPFGSLIIESNRSIDCNFNSCYQWNWKMLSNWSRYYVGAYVHREQLECSIFREEVICCPE